MATHVVDPGTDNAADNLRTATFLPPSAAAFFNFIKRLMDPQAAMLDERLDVFMRDGPPAERDGLADDQHPAAFHIPGLRAQPWWHPAPSMKTDPSVKTVVTLLREAYPAVHSEVSMLLKTPHSRTVSELGRGVLPVESGEWTKISLIDEGRWNQAVCKRLPATVALLRRLPLCESTLGYAYLSRLAPGTSIAPHHGPTNVKLRAQLPLLLGPTDEVSRAQQPIDSADGEPTNEPLPGTRRLVVGDQWHEYVAGEPLIFDDSFRHSVSNMTPHARVVLLIDLWHPRLTRRSISQLTRAFAPAAPSGSDAEDKGSARHTAVASSGHLRCLRAEEEDKGAHRGTETLPDEVLELVLASLDVAELGRAAAACGRWAELIRGDGVWRALYERECGADGTSLAVVGGTSEGGWCEWYREEVHLLFDRLPDAWDSSAIAAAAAAAGVATSTEPRSSEEQRRETVRMGLAWPPPTKLLMVGDAGVGKSCFLMRFTEDVYVGDVYIATIGVDFKIKRVAMRGKPMRLMIWDTAGPERFRTISSSYYRGAHGVFVMFDVTDRASFGNVRHWVQQVRTHGKSATRVMIVGLKAGEEELRSVAEAPGRRASQARPREVSTAEARQLAAELSEELGFLVPYRECSSRKGLREVEQATYVLAREVERCRPDLEITQPRARPRVDPKGKCVIL